MLAGIFVGGASSRMGRPKGLLPAGAGGETVAARLVRVAREAGLDPVLVGRHPSYDALPVPVLDDTPGARGPLAGLLALLEAARGDHAIALACDMPFVSARLLRKLAGAEDAPIVAPRGEAWEPLFARYHASRVLDAAREAARRERWSLQALFAEVGARALELGEQDRAELVDWDTPEDVERNPTLARATALRDVKRFEGAGVTTVRDRLAVEEPLEIRVGREPVAVTMRTPGADVDLAAGFLLGEGVVRGRDDVRSASPEGGNAVVLDLSDAARERLSRADRRFWVTSSCGVCGKESLARVRATIEPLERGFTVTREVLSRVPEALRTRQSLFDRTGGLHAAGLFTLDGELLRAAEDVGRHNAVDKVLGAELLAGRLPAYRRDGAILTLSGRVAFELVQKAALAGVPFVVAVGAPTSLAVELAEEVGITVVGFARDERFNVYSNVASVQP